MACQRDRQEGKRRIEEQGLIPGLPDDIVIRQIATRIPWSSMYSLAWVNREWRRAIRSREIYDMRQLSGLSQSMVVAPMETGLQKGSFDVTRHMGFYDVESQDTYLFPPQGLPHMSVFCPPGLRYGAPSDPPPEDLVHSLLSYFQTYVKNKRAYITVGIVFLDGKLYALQESMGPLGKVQGNEFEEVQVLDIGACEWEWKACTKVKRCSNGVNFDCTRIWAACDGKMYSFHTCKRCFHGKVFDPKNETWREIEERPMNAFHATYSRCPSSREFHCGRTAVLNKEIYVAYACGATMMIFDSVAEKWRIIINALKLIPSFHRRNLSECFTIVAINENLYNFSKDYVLRYDQECDSWIEWRRSFHPAFMDEAASVPDVLAVAHHGDELIGMLALSDRHFKFSDGTSRRFCKSVGFSNPSVTLLWVDCSAFSFKNPLFTQIDERVGHREPPVLLDYLEL